MKERENYREKKKIRIFLILSFCSKKFKTHFHAQIFYIIAQDYCLKF